MPRREAMILRDLCIAAARGLRAALRAGRARDTRPSPPPACLIRGPGRGAESSTMTKHAVVIAGGSPTALMAAELALAHVGVAIVERRTSQAVPGMRAGGLHTRTIEVLFRHPDTLYVASEVGDRPECGGIRGAPWHRAHARAAGSSRLHR